MQKDTRFGFGAKTVACLYPMSCRAYYVRTMRGSIGYVESRKLPGHRLWWAAYRFGGERVGERFPTRLAAAIALHERAQGGTA